MRTYPTTQEVWATFTKKDKKQCHAHNYYCLHWGIYGATLIGDVVKYQCGCF